MALGAMQSSGKLRLLYRGPGRRGGANGLLGGGFPWLEVLRLELELGSNGGSRREGKIREERKNGAGEWIEETLGSLSPALPA